MEFIKSYQNEFEITIEALKQGLKKYIVVHKKVTKAFLEEKTYELHILDEMTNVLTFKEESIQSFSKKYLEVGENEEITKISIYDGELQFEIAPYIKVVIFEPNKHGYVKEIPNSTKELETIVEGDIEYVYVGREDFVLICNDVGMLENLPLNRGIHGTFLFQGLKNGESCSLNDQQIQLIMNEFDNKDNFESKSDYLKNYFKNNPIERKVFLYEFENNHIYIGTESVIEYILSHDKEENLKEFETAIKEIERNKTDIYPYLKKIGQEMAYNKV